MAEKNQPGISQKIKTFCDEYSSRSMILNENNGKTFGKFISSVAQNLSKALINHQLLILASNRKLHFYNTTKTDTNRTKFLACSTQPTPPSPPIPLTAASMCNGEVSQRYLELSYFRKLYFLQISDTKTTFIKHFVDSLIFISTAGLKIFWIWCCFIWV